VSVTYGCVVGAVNDEGKGDPVTDEVDQLHMDEQVAQAKKDKAKKKQVCTVLAV
jgi:hypothetical protein